MKLFSSVSAVACLVAMPALANVSVPSWVATGNMVFDDEFNGSTLDTTKWSCNNGWEMANSSTFCSNVSVANGKMVMSLAGANSGTYVCSSAPSVNDCATSTSAATGLAVGDYAEARVYIPGSAGTNTAYNWGAWWTSAGAPSPWPAEGEHDIVEGDPQPDITYHSPSGQHSQGTPSGTWINAYHVYGVWRQANSTNIYWDGALKASYSTDDNGGIHDLLADIGNSTGPDCNCGGPTVYGVNSRWLIDYVHVYRPGATGITPQTNYGGPGDDGTGSNSSPVNGACGSANGIAASTAPTANLCSAGTPTAVSGSGPWTWTCNGSNGGTNSATCTAPLTTGGGGGGTGGEITSTDYITGFTWYDNSPAGNGSFNGVTLGGSGTYADPTSIAVGFVGTDATNDVLDFPLGTKFYIPNLQRYFKVDGICASCHAGSGGHVWMDVWLNGQSNQSAATSCASAITGNWTVVRNPASNYAVTSGDIYNASTGCTSQFGNTLVVAGGGGGGTGTGANIMVNPGFENGSTGWSLGSGSTVTTAAAHSGTHSVTTTNTNGLDQYTPSQPNSTTYNFSVWMKNISGAIECGVGSYTGSYVTATSTSWAQYSSTFTTTSSGVLDVWCSNPSGYADDLSLTIAGSSPPPATKTTVGPLSGSIGPFTGQECFSNGLCSPVTVPAKSITVPIQPATGTVITIPAQTVPTP